MCFGFVHLFNCRAAEPPLAGRVVVCLLIFIFIDPSRAEKVKTSRHPPSRRGWRFGVRGGGWRGGSPGHCVLLGHTDQNEAYSP